MIVDVFNDSVFIMWLELEIFLLVIIGIFRVLVIVVVLYIVVFCVYYELVSWLLRVFEVLKVWIFRCEVFNFVL